MADHSKIEWTDATWNPITGCSVVSAGCKHCYAMKLAGTRLQHHPSRAGLTQDTGAGPVWNGQVRFNEDWLDQPLRWRRQRRIFVCAHGDLFHENVPDEWIDQVFAIMAMAPHHVFQVLTKRAGRMRACLAAAEMNIRDNIKYEPAAETMVWPLPNVHLGVSLEDQPSADERIGDLLQTPAAVRWVSAEPLLAAVDLRPYLDWAFANADMTRPDVNWVVVGGESGINARPMHPDWARSLRDQCETAGVPFLFKQWGEWVPADQCDSTTGDALYTDGGKDLAHRHLAVGIDGYAHTDALQAGAEPQAVLYRAGKKAAGRLLDGIEHNGYPTTS